MVITLIWVIVILGFLFQKYYITKRKWQDNVPEYPGALPIIGHAHKLIGDDVYFFDIIKKASMKAVENDGIISFWIGPIKYYIITDPDDSLTVLNSTTDRHIVYSFADYWIGDGLFTVNGKKWQIHKKLIYPFFNQQNLNKFFVIFNKQGRRMIEQFKEHIGNGIFNHEPYSLLIGLETVCQTALGTDVGEQIARNKEFVNAIKGIMQAIMDRIKKVWLYKQNIYEMSHSKKKHDKHLKVINSMSGELINKRIEEFDLVSGTVKKDIGGFNPFIDSLIKIFLKNESFTKKQIHDEINTLIVTGYETFALGAIYNLMMLGHHQDVQEKVYKELQEVFGETDRDVDKYDMTKLVYLDAVVKETLRLIPLLPIVARKVPCDLKLRNHTLRAGSNIVVSFYGLHRSLDWGPDRHQFKPERFLSPETMPNNPNLWAPFGMGKRYCVGKTYAMMSLKTSLVHVLRNYKVTSDMTDLVMQMHILTKPASGQHISLERRMK